MTQRLEGKVAIVTGGGTGIGRASAIRFAREGAKVVVTGRRRGPVEDVALEIRSEGGEALALPSDVSVVADTQRIISETVNRFQALHVLFNNAATVDLNKSVEELTVEEWDGCIDTTLRSVFLLSKWAAPIMRESGGGSIINCGSVGGIMAWRGGAAYCAAKSGILALTKVLAIEFGAWKIRVNTLSPGAIMTPNLQRVLDDDPDARERLYAKSTFRRVGDPDEVSSAAVFLASDESSFVTATNLVVDGGYLTL